MTIIIDSFTYYTDQILEERRAAAQALNEKINRENGWPGEVGYVEPRIAKLIASAMAEPRNRRAMERVTGVAPRRQRSSPQGAPRRSTCSDACACFCHLPGKGGAHPGVACSGKRIGRKR